MERRKKTNRMLITVTIIFFVSWAPLNLFNILLDIFEPFDNTEQADMYAMFDNVWNAKCLQGGYNCKHCQTRLTCLEQDRKLMLMIFAICHLSAMTSVVTNPVMYGFLNENFKTSLVYILSNFYCFKRIFPTNLQVGSNNYCPFPT